MLIINLTVIKIVINTMLKVIFHPLYGMSLYGVISYHVTLSVDPLAEKVDNLHFSILS